MPKRGPALYELISERPPARPPAEADSDASTGPPPVSERAGRDAERAPAFRHTPVRRQAARPQPEADEPESPFSAMLAPGRVIRVPVGYIWFTVAAFIGIAVAAYAIGHRAATAEHEAETRAFAQLGMPDLEPAGNGDALDQTPFDPLIDRRSRELENTSAESDDTPGTPAPAPVGLDTRPITGSDLPNVYFVGGDVGDPRRSGFNYLVLATLIPTEEAERIALFFGERGLSMVRLAPTSRGLCTVTTFDGVSGEGYRSNSKQRRDLEDAVSRIGRAFRAGGGYTDFADAYWDRVD